MDLGVRRREREPGGAPGEVAPQGSQPRSGGRAQGARGGGLDASDEVVAGSFSGGVVGERRRIAGLDRPDQLGQGTGAVVAGKLGDECAQRHRSRGRVAPAEGIQHVVAQHDVAAVLEDVELHESGGVPADGRDDTRATAPCPVATPTRARRAPRAALIECRAVRL